MKVVFELLSNEELKGDYENICCIETVPATEVVQGYSLMCAEVENYEDIEIVNTFYIKKIERVIDRNGTMWAVKYSYHY